MSIRSVLLAVVVAALIGGAAVVAAVLARHSSRFLAGRAYRAPAARAELRRSLEQRGAVLARALQDSSEGLRAATGAGPRRAEAVRALSTGHELGSVSSALLPLLEPSRRAEAEQRLGELRRSLSDLDRLAGGEAWSQAGATPAAACAASCLGPRDRCWAAAGGYAAKCEGLALEAAGCVARCR